MADPEAFYAELTTRNAPLVSPSQQEALRRTRFVVAGCGSTGGAVVMPLVRTGAERFVLLDPGAYELNNCNRQDATQADLGRNKAAATADRILAVNPFASVEVHEAGVQPGSISEVLAPGDVVMDAVDVTTQPGVDAKLALHEAACAARLPVLTAYDIAGTQFLELYDYRELRTPLRGRVPAGADPGGLLKALVPPLVLPREILPELRLRRRSPERPFPQLAMTSTLLGALAVPYFIALVTGAPVRRKVRVDLNSTIRPWPAELKVQAARMVELAQTWWAYRD
jgi:tRNA threonylcarbamoyladenosine dehydratase